jgi:hypothetical protein
MRRWVWVLAFLLLFYPAQGIVINEVMYDLPGTDTDREWIEIYNNEAAPVNMSEFKLFEANTNHAINFVQGSEIIGASEFAIIADDTSVFLADWPGFAGSLFDSSFSLSNTGEGLVIRNSSLDAVENITYDTAMGAAGNGNTLCRYPDGNVSLVECTATPGFANAVNQTINTTVQDNTNTTNTTNNTIISACDLTVSIIANSTLYNSGQTIDYDIFVNDTACSGQQHEANVSYSIDDLFGANQISGITSQTFSCRKTVGRQWTPSLAAGSEAYIINARITDAGCNETDPANNSASLMIVVKSVQPPITSCPAAAAAPTSSVGGGGCPAVSSTVPAQPNYEILSYSDTVAVGEEFTTRVKIRNNFTSPKEYTVYSYAYRGNTPVSLGYSENEDKWLGTYTANQRSVSIDNGASDTLDMVNVIEEGTEPGTYNLRVRIRFDSSQYDITKQITVTEKEGSSVQAEAAAVASGAEESGNETENTTANTASAASLTRATGFSAARNPNPAFLLSPVSVLLEFLFSLLNS